MARSGIYFAYLLYAAVTVELLNALSARSSYRPQKHSIGGVSLIDKRIRIELLSPPSRLCNTAMNSVSSSRASEDNSIINEDPNGIFNLIGVSSKFFVSGISTIVLYSTESWIPLYYIVGSILNGVLSKCLKIIIKEPRPPQSGKGGYGMPSSHTQAFFFFLAVVAMNCSRFLGTRSSLILSLSALAYSCIASYWRIVTEVHSVSQTLVGAVVGLLFGVFFVTKEAAAASYFEPLIGNRRGVPLVLKFVISTLGAMVICKSEIKSLLKYCMKKMTKKKS